MSKTLDEIRALLAKHNVTVGMLRKPVAKGGAGIAPLTAKKLVGTRKGEVSLESAEKALAFVRARIVIKQARSRPLTPH